MNIKGIYIVLALLFLNSLVVSAQSWNVRKYEFSYGLGLSNFMGDVAAPKDSKFVWIKFFNTIGPIADAGLKYRFTDHHYAGATVTLGQLYAEDPLGDVNYWYRGIKTSSFFTELTVRYEYLIVKEKSKSTIYRKLGESSLKNINIPTYVFIGMGGEFNIGKFSRLTSDGKTIETTSYTNLAPVLPVGFGFKMKLTNLTSLNLEAGWRFTLSDKIDNASGNESPQYGKWYDQYQFVTINVIHKLRANKKGLPKFSFR